MQVIRYARRLPLSILVPVVALASWSVVLAPEVIRTVYQLHQAARGSDSVRIQTGQFQMIIPRQRWLAFAMDRTGLRYDHAVAAANLPATTVEALISLPLSWPYLWHPNGLTMPAWRTFSYPFFCLPAWWFAGIGLEVLTRPRRLHWMVFAGSVGLSFICLVLLIGLRFGVSSTDQTEDAWVLWGLGFWSVAFVLPALAWIRQKRLAKA